MTPKNDLFQSVAAAGPAKDAGRVLLIVFSVLALAGTAAFVAGVLGADPERAWQAYLINFVFWAGLCMGAVLLSAIISICNAHWGRSVKRLADSFGAYLPVSFLLFWVLYWGKEKLFPWILNPVPEKEAYLNVGFFFLREGLALLILAVLAGALIYFSVQRDRKAIAAGSLPSDSEATEAEEQRIVRLSIAYGILYSFLLSMFAIDLIMSLDPHWYSSLFGAYYFMGSFYTGLAAVAILSAIAVKTMRLEEFIGARQFHDLGNLLLGFCIVTADFFYVQFLVQWYGNLPEETHYVIRRIYIDPWPPVAWAVLIVCFVFPFGVFMRRNLKRNPTAMLAMGTVILLGMWLERFMLVAPSIWKGTRLPIGFTELFITLGFFGIVALCVLVFLQRCPLLPIADPLFHKQLEAYKQGR
jgi:Ni/Fe-hydrogenase subunit HybB-like protein